MRAPVFEVDEDTLAFVAEYLDDCDEDVPVSVRGAVGDLRTYLDTDLSDFGLHSVIIDMCAARRMPMKLDS